MSDDPAAPWTARPGGRELPVDFKQMLEAERLAQQRNLRLIEECCANGDYYSASGLALTDSLSDEVPKILYRRWAAGLVAVEDLQLAIYDTWTHNKTPLRGLGERSWLRMFKAAKFFVVTTEPSVLHSDGTRSEVPIKFSHLTERPTVDIEVWRGAALHSKGRGMSWSVHRECARENFAQAWADLYGSPTGLFRALVPPKAVLAFFGDEREQEVVVNPNMLRGRVTLVETITESEGVSRRALRGTQSFKRGNR